ncbi:MAG: hypothetical protein K8F52_07250 [Candidatus Scalindua rubra]|nr:hypothetical protein [Candidatus Scalindua rubra]
MAQGLHERLVVPNYSIATRFRCPPVKPEGELIEVVVKVLVAYVAMKATT